MPQAPLRRSQARPSWGPFRWLLTALCIAYAIVLVWATHAPRLSQPQISVGSIPPDKFLHFFAYTVLGTLAVIATNAWGWLSRRTIFSLLVGLSIFAFADELTQPFFSRAADLFDWMADAVGAFTGLAVASTCHLIVRWRGMPSE